ncbi:uncharacterized protein BO72DRAFT_220041 [Aspergillus fijiensis CBS 313.89]|uniref:Uncharacterized protein n=1 Tax=Aspergillus fijiensis CBS 313.89 TaxID=1448319 RepID=A0A8G1RIN7_9EURO|nr:uncharacterized protein BO72DRAFT_220041 [Aspergillus fijiensis CBS 313.89]RAK74045.1 hypothetical protein BO72DRAFT_220041 [Aspergillus fijiensis CBS 313.89]
MCFNRSLATRYEISHGHSQRVGPEPVEGETRKTRWSGQEAREKRALNWAAIDCSRWLAMRAPVFPSLRSPATAGPTKTGPIEDADMAVVLLYLGLTWPPAIGETYLVWTGKA